MKRICIISLLVLLALTAGYYAFAPRPIAADLYPNETLDVDGERRGYRFVIPHAIREPAPLVFAFHGVGDSVESMADYSQFDRLASRHGFLLVYPAARGAKWRTAGASMENVEQNPDVRFFDQLLAELSSRHKVARDRIYLLGMSNGASFAQLLAIARPKKVAAVVAHSGSKPAGLGLPQTPLRIMLVGGAEDPARKAIAAAADDYRSAGNEVRFVSVPGLAHAWSARHNAEMWEFLSGRLQASR